MINGRDGDQVKRRLYVLLAAVILLISALVYGTVFSSVNSELNNGNSDDFSSVMEVITLVRSRFYKPVDTTELLSAYVTTGSINGMLAETLQDPYTRFMDQHAYEGMLSDTSGVFGGIGIVIGIQDDQLTIVSPIKGTPGERGGLRAQDKIIKIDNRDTHYMTTEEAASLMRGAPGTEVTLTIQRGDEVLEVLIVRDLINVNSIDKAVILEPGIGYIYLTNFSDRTYEELVKALADLDEQGMEGLILDLRFNPGGTLAAALQVANEFVAEGSLVYLEDRDGNRIGYEATKQGTREEIPMVVLVNGSSASASEIVSGALRDNDLAVLVGTHTFGKGLVQSVIPLRDGGAITLTEQVYLTAGGHDINQVGLLPDYELEIDEEEELAIYLGDTDVEDTQLMKALEIVRSKLSK
ncbi:MAG: S41 family peptidase [Firmicutes bacterium]|nr:S41 family peptidase [Bacillota bacterium]